MTQTRPYIEPSQAAPGAACKIGTAFAKITCAIKLPNYELRAMYNEWFPMNVLRVMLDMYMGPFPWRPNHAYEVNK